VGPGSKRCASLFNEALITGPGIFNNAETGINHHESEIQQRTMKMQSQGPKPTECKDNLFCGVNMAESNNVDEMTDLAKKHVPVITAPDVIESSKCFEVVIETGKLLAHPNQPDHFINFVELYADHTYLGRQHFVHTFVCPVAKFCVQLEHIHQELRAFAWCNKHGTWESTKPLTLR
jgi:superoxide reductase